MAHAGTDDAHEDLVLTWRSELDRFDRVLPVRLAEHCGLDQHGAAFVLGSVTVSSLISGVLVWSGI